MNNLLILQLSKGSIFLSLIFFLRFAIQPKPCTNLTLILGSLEVLLPRKYAQGQDFFRVISFIGLTT